MRRGLSFILALIPVSLLAADISVIPVNDDAAPFVINDISHANRGEADRESLTFTIDHAASDAGVQVKYLIKVVSKNGDCKTGIRMTREVDLHESGRAELNVALRTLEDGDKVYLVPLGLDGEPTEGQLQRMDGGYGSCLSQCQAMKDACLGNCLPSGYCWYCDIPQCQVLDCYCSEQPSGYEECQSPYHPSNW